jgi:hypothetical protein
MNKKPINIIFSWILARKKYLLRFFWIGLSILIFIAIIYQFMKGWQTIKNYPWNWNKQYIYFAFLFYSIGLLGTASVWSSIISKLSGKTKYFDNLKLFCITNLAQRIPTPIPYIGARTEAYAKLGIDRNITLTGLSIEVTITIISGAFLALITIPFGVNRNLNGTTIISLAILIPLLCFIFRPSVLIKILNKIFLSFHQTGKQIEIKTNDMLLWFVYFVPIWINNGIIHYFIIKSIYPVESGNIFLIFNAVAISGVISWLGQFFFLIPNIATKQLSIAYLLSYIIPWEVAIIVAIAARLLVLIFEIFWFAIISLFSVKIYKQLKSSEE